jgi:predicted amidophosphoribosyltransferase
VENSSEWLRGFPSARASDGSSHQRLARSGVASGVGAHGPMICSHCQRENPPHNAFCHACGTPLSGGASSSAQSAAAAPAAKPIASRCSRCGTDNPKQMQFCRTCGNDMTAAAAAAPPNRAPAAAPANAPPPLASLPAIAPLPATGAPPAMSGPPMCRRCGGQGDQTSRFCKFCGAPFDAPSTSHQPAVQARAQAEQAPTHVLPPSSGPAGATRGQVVIIQRDGSEGGVFPLEAPQTDLGSRDADIVLADDPYMAPRHARIERRG